MLDAVSQVGVATFLFSDIEDSTALLRLLGDTEYARLLDEHRLVIDEAVTAAGGRCVDAEGDGTLSVFAAATSACRAAVAAQRALASHEWPAPLRVRMGLHTGEAQRLDSHPVGLALHQAQRVCNAGHGGQLLLSDATRQILGHALPEATTLRDLGEFEVRNFDAPQRLFQVCGDDLAGDFPELRVPPATSRPSTDGTVRAVRVLVADDQELVRTGLRMILQPQPTIDVIGEAADGRQAVSEVLRLRPDVVLMDIRMPNLDGIEATAQIVKQSPTTKVVILTTFDLDEYVYRALQAGASGFLLKDAPPAEIVAALEVVARGDAMLAPAVTRRLLNEFAKRASGVHPAAPRLASLSDREAEVLALIARGFSNAEIASELVLGENTVKTHVGSVFSKLGVRDRVAAVVLAYEAGVVAPGGAEE
jgi:DNA-binding NarL/FixJ family response regulator